MESPIFTTDEVSEFTDIQKIRHDLIKQLTKDGVPVKGPDKVLLATLLDGSDRSTFTRAKLRNDKAEAENAQNVIKLVGETLRSVNARTYRPVANDSQRIIPDALIRKDFVPGELDIHPEQIEERHVIHD